MSLFTGTERENVKERFKNKKDGVNIERQRETKRSRGRKYV